MLSKRLVFTFGTLYEPKIIEALLGIEPPNFRATIKGFSVYKGTGAQVPEMFKQELAQRYDLDNFSFLFAKPNLAAPGSTIEGKVYEIDLAQELILDRYERYPFWYRKIVVDVEDVKGTTHSAFVYTIDHDGELVEKHERVVNNLDTMVASARNRRQIVLEQFPNLFSA